MSDKAFGTIVLVVLLLLLLGKCASALTPDTCIADQGFKYECLDDGSPETHYDGP